MYKIFIRSILIFILLYALLSCATSEKSKDTPIIINEVHAKVTDNNQPKESEFQVNVMLSAILGKDNEGKDLFYEWKIKPVKLDIDGQDNTSAVGSENSDSNEKTYFLEVSKNPLEGMISFYKEGYYKISLTVSNTNETKTNSLILKIGNPEFPDLYLKLNTPPYDETSDSGEYKGGIYFNNSSVKNKSTGDIKFINSKDVFDKWYKTDYKINPFNTFTINSGTHIILKNQTKMISSFSKNSTGQNYDVIQYDLDGGKTNQVKISPILLNNLNSNNLLSIYKSPIVWYKGEIFLSFLSWGYNDDGNDEFIFFEKSLTETNKTVTTYLNNKYLMKVFIGSIGKKIFNNGYYVYFGPEGTDTEELDPLKTRDVLTLPYGYLLGKLGKNGKVFPIGNLYTYTNTQSIPIYVLDKNNSFVLESAVQ